MKRFIFALVAILLCLLALGLLMEAGFRGYLHYRQPGSVEDGFELYTVGGSTAAGEPYNREVAFAAVASKMFDNKVNGEAVLYLPVATANDSLLTQTKLFLEQLLHRDEDNPGLVMIYAGHNEWLSPEDSTAASGSLASWAKRNIVSRSVLLMRMVHALRIDRHHQNRFTLAEYETNLRIVIERSLAYGLQPVISTVASNLADVEPNVPLQLKLPDALRARLRACLGGCEPAPSMAFLQDALRHPEELEAFLRYQLAKTHRELGQYPEALEQHLRAVDTEQCVTFSRAKRPQNKIIKRLAGEYKIPLLDAAALLARRSKNGILGKAVFMDGQHLNMDGYIVLAKALAQVISKKYNQPILRALDRPEQVFEAFSFGKKLQVQAHIKAGSWLFSSSCHHPWARDRLSWAVAHFKEALRLKPDHFSGWFGLALAEAAIKGDLLQDPESVDHMASWKLYHEPFFCVPPAELEQMVVRLRAQGIAPEILQGIARSKEQGTSGACQGQVGVP